MAEVKWIKITTNMFEDEKIDFIESLPESDAILVIWIKLLAQAGKNNTNGFIFLTEKIPYTEEMLSHKFRRPLSTVRLALKTLEQLEMIIFDDTGFIKIANWEKHQNIEGLDKIREQGRLRQAKYRESQKKLKAKKDSNVTVTLCNGTEREEERELERELEEDKRLLLQDKEEKKKSSSSSSLEIDENIKLIVKEYQRCGFGPMDLTTKDLLEELLEQHSTEWIIEAFKICVDSNKRNLKYARGILNNWKTEGGMKLGGKGYGTNRNGAEGEVDEYAGLGFTFEDVQKL